IESITVLKGPAATALYGIEAASGAIIITTKKGSGGTGGVHVSFNSSESWDMVNKLPDLQKIYAQGNNGIYKGPNSGGSSKKFSWGPSIDTLFWDGATTSVWD